MKTVSMVGGRVPAEREDFPCHPVSLTNSEVQKSPSEVLVLERHFRKQVCLPSTYTACPGERFRASCEHAAPLGARRRWPVMSRAQLDAWPPHPDVVSTAPGPGPPKH